MTEPTAAPLDPPVTEPAERQWAEARPPHLPDTVTRVPWMVWPFVVLALVQAYAAWRGWVDQGANAGFLVPTLRIAAADLASVLIGAAFFVRHPDGLRRLPLIAFAVTLFAVQEALLLASGPLSTVFDSLTPADAATPFFVPLAYAYSLLAAAIGIFAVLYLARGLGEARRTMDEGSMRGLTIGLVLVVVTYGVLGTASIIRSDFEVSPLNVLLVGVAIGTSVISLLAWSALIVVSLAGWLGGEEPRLGWLLAALSGAAFLLAQVVIVVAELIIPVVSPRGDTAWLGEALGLLFQLGSIVLLVAFVLGLPSTAETAWTDLDHADDEPGGDDADRRDAVEPSPSPVDVAAGPVV